MEHKRTLTVPDGTSLTYRLWRPGQPRQLLLLIHGMGSNMTRWSEFTAHTALKESWDLLRLDLRGHGRSPCRGALNMETWCRDLGALLNAEGYPHAVVMGHSLGALIALWFGHLHPRHAQGLILVEPSFSDAARGMTRTMRHLRPVIRLLAVLTRGLGALGLGHRHIPYRSLWEWDKEVRQKLLAHGAREELIKLYTSPWVDLKYNLVSNYLQDLLQVLRPLPPLKHIKVPVLTLLSSNARFADRKATDRILAQLQKNRTVVLDATHWIMTETPNEARQAIERWCHESF